MSQARNTVEWCLNHAHRGLVRRAPDIARARAHIDKAEHDLRAMKAFSKGFSDWSASVGFYSMYHCLLAVLALRGFESSNQTCTFAAVRLFIEEGFGFEERLLERIASREPSVHAPSAVHIRESLQYGVSVTLDPDAYEDLLDLVHEVLGRTKQLLGPHLS